MKMIATQRNYKVSLLIVAILVLLLPSPQNLNAQDLLSDEPSISFGELTKNYFNIGKAIENKTYISADWGMMFPSFGKSQKEEFAEAYLLDFAYGFARNYSYDKYPNVKFQQTEKVFFGNVSSHMKFSTKNESGFTIDSWRFGFGRENYVGWFSEDAHIMLGLVGSFVWTHTDFELLSLDSAFASLQKSQDEKIKFGLQSRYNIDFKLVKSLSINVGWEQTNSFGRFDTFEMIGSIAIENLLLRSIDFFDPLLVNKFGQSYPILKFASKTAISYLFGQMRRQSNTFPFGGTESFVYDGIVVGLNLRI